MAKERYTDPTPALIAERKALLVKKAIHQSNQWDARIMEIDKILDFLHWGIIIKK